MPYKDPVKKAKHYSNYQKPYMKEWVKKNKEDWNEYQKNYKVRKRFEEANSIIESVEKLGIAEINSLAFNAGIILFYMLRTNIYKPWAISYRTGILISDIKTVQHNWIKNKVWSKNSGWNFEETKNDIEEIVQITLICLIGSGDIIRFLEGYKIKQIRKVKNGAYIPVIPTIK
ncbi:hypothetical protein EP331_00375 [bacterium]|nr:MAG: hypothetical protein EP331_00375 [bacterium]